MKAIIVYVLLMHEGASYQLGEVLPKMKEKKKCHSLEKNMSGATTMYMIKFMKVYNR